MDQTGCEPDDWAVPLGRRRQLLAAVPALAALSGPALRKLASALTEESYLAGAAVVTEGEAGDRLFLIVAGRAEVSTGGPQGPLALAGLGPGDVFGEMALVLPGGRRGATVAALSRLRLL